MLEVQAHAQKLLARIYDFHVTEEAAVSILDEYPELAWLANCLRRCPVPPGWTSQEGNLGTIHYINTESGESSETPPLLQQFADLALLMLHWRQDPTSEADVAKAILAHQQKAVEEALRARKVWDGPHIDAATGVEFWHCHASGRSCWGDPGMASEFVARIAERLQKALPCQGQPNSQMENQSVATIDSCCKSQESMGVEMSDLASSSLSRPASSKVRPGSASKISALSPRRLPTSVCSESPIVNVGEGKSIVGSDTPRSSQRAAQLRKVMHDLVASSRVPEKPAVICDSSDSTNPLHAPRGLPPDKTSCMGSSRLLDRGGRPSAHGAPASPPPAGKDEHPIMGRQSSIVREASAELCMVQRPSVLQRRRVSSVEHLDALGDTGTPQKQVRFAEAADLLSPVTRAFSSSRHSECRVNANTNTEMLAKVEKELAASPENRKSIGAPSAPGTPRSRPNTRPNGDVKPATPRGRLPSRGGVGVGASASQSPFNSTAEVMHIQAVEIAKEATVAAATAAILADQSDDDAGADEVLGATGCSLAACSMAFGETVNSACSASSDRNFGSSAAFNICHGVIAAAFDEVLGVDKNEDQPGLAVESMLQTIGASPSSPCKDERIENMTQRILEGALAPASTLASGVRPSTAASEMADISVSEASDTSVAEMVGDQLASIASKFVEAAADMDQAPIVKSRARAEIVPTVTSMVAQILILDEGATNVEVVEEAAVGTAQNPPEAIQSFSVHDVRMGHSPGRTLLLSPSLCHSPSLLSVRGPFSPSSPPDSPSILVLDEAFRESFDCQRSDIDKCLKRSGRLFGCPLPPPPSLCEGKPVEMKAAAQLPPANPTESVPTRAERPVRCRLPEPLSARGEKRCKEFTDLLATGGALHSLLSARDARDRSSSRRNTATAQSPRDDRFPAACHESPQRSAGQARGRSAVGKGVAPFPGLSVTEVASARCRRIGGA